VLRCLANVCCVLYGVHRVDNVCCAVYTVWLTCAVCCAVQALLRSKRESMAVLHAREAELEQACQHYRTFYKDAMSKIEATDSSLWPALSRALQEEAEQGMQDVEAAAHACRDMGTICVSLPRTCCLVVLCGINAEPRWGRGGGLGARRPAHAGTATGAVGQHHGSRRRGG
jgi:hypothetical protein